MLRNSKFTQSDLWTEDNYFIPGRVYRYRTPIVAKRLGIKRLLLEGLNKSETAYKIPYNEFMFKGKSPKSEINTPELGLICRGWCEEVK